MQDPTNAATFACEALDCIYRTLNLESARLARQTRLHDLLRQSFQLLSSQHISKQLAMLRAKRDPIGLVGTAWLELRTHLRPGELLDYNDLAESQIDRALDLLDEIPAGQRKPLDLRLAYELIVHKSPTDFPRQLELMEEFATSLGNSTSSHVSS